MARAFPLITSKPVPTGTPEYEATKKAIVKQFVDSVPEELYIPQSYIDNPPKNVTGIPRECGILTKEEIAITENYDAVALLEAIRLKKLTSVAIVKAFAKRAIIAHQLTGCLTEWFMDEGLARAAELDAHYAATGQLVGPLHGLPFSLKEHMPVTGHYSSCGFLSTRVMDTTDAHAVAILRKLGAVFYCKTAQPQAIMHLESVHPLGRVLNPYNTGLSSGGSTGGEAALLALHGSVLGLGSDIGGSIRCPAGFCGIYGFKPTSVLLPCDGIINGGAASELNIPATIGPMANSLRDLDLFMSVVLAEKPYIQDPRLTPIPWTGLGTPVASSRPLKIGLLFNDGHIQPQPPVTRALEWARTQLLAYGKPFEVKVFAPPPKAEEAIQRIRKEYWPEGGHHVQEAAAAAGEPVFPLTQWIIQDAIPGGELNATQLHEVRMARAQYQVDFAAHWNSQDVDVVVCPVFVGTACEHDTSFYWNYTAFWNYVDYPGVVLPTPVQAKAKGTETYASSTPLSKEDQHVRELWAAGDFEGAPVDLQVVARRNADNDLFGALAVMQKAFTVPPKL